MIVKNEQTLKNVTCISLLLTAFLSQAQATENTYDKEIDRINRLKIFNLFKFEESINIDGDLKNQMTTRNFFWNKPSLPIQFGEEVIGYTVNQIKIINYIPYYIKDILDIKCASELDFKEDFYSDFLNLMKASYKYIFNKNIKILNEKLYEINLERYPLSQNFFRFATLKKDKLVYNHFPLNWRKKIDMILIDEKFNNPRFKYHKSLEEKYKLDQEIIKKLSVSKCTQERLKSIMFLHNDIYK